MLTRKVVVALLAGIVGVVLTASLGNWQTRRGDEKAARQAQWDEAIARAPSPIASFDDAAGIAGNLPQRVEFNGAFVPEATVYIDNRLVDGVAGFQVVTPVAVAEGLPWILVNRGWAPRDMADRARLPAAPIAGAPLRIEGAPLRIEGAPLRIEGVAVPYLPRALDLGEPGGPLGGIWQNLDFEAYERASGRRVARFVVQQTNDTGDGLRRAWPRPDTGVDRHRGYAFQWYSLAALIAALMLYFGGRAVRRT